MAHTSKKSKKKKKAARFGRVKKRTSVRGILTSRKSKQLSSLVRVNGITVRQDEYARQLVYGGEYHTIGEWAKIFRVTPATVLRWNATPRMQTHMRELVQQRRQQMEVVFGQRFVDVVHCLLDIMHASSEYVLYKTVGKKHVKQLRLDASLQRARIEAARELATLIGMRPTEDGKPGVQISQTFTALHQAQGDMAQREQDRIRREFEELRTVNAEVQG